MLLSVLQPVCVRSENGSPRGSELSKQEQKKRPVTENCVLYISAAQRLKHLAPYVWKLVKWKETNQKSYIYFTVLLSLLPFYARARARSIWQSAWNFSTSTSS